MASTQRTNSNLGIWRFNAKNQQRVPRTLELGNQVQFSPQRPQKGPYVYFNSDIHPQVINMYFNSNSSHAGRKTSVPNIWHPFHPCREGPFQTSLSPLEDLQKVVVRASQGNGVSLWERSDLLKSLSRPAQVSLQCRWPGSKVPPFPTVQSPESPQVHIGVVV